MSPRLNLTYPTALVLQALSAGFHYGFDIMDATGLPSGTVYPILRRLDREGLLESEWEEHAEVQREQRPPRRYYEITALGDACSPTPSPGTTPSRRRSRRPLAV